MMSRMAKRTRSSDTAPNRKRVVAVAALFVLTVALVAAGLVYDGQRLEQARTATATESAYVAPDDPTQPLFAVPADPRLLILGDSYTLGTNAQPRTEGYAFVLAKTLGWANEIDGVGGTGFTWGGGEQGTDGNDYISRINRRAAAGGFIPNVLLLQGGQNDYRAFPEEVSAKVAETIMVARAAWPDVQIVVMGPSQPMPGGALLQRVSTPIGRAALAQRAPFINPLGAKWFTNENSAQYYGDANGSHLNSEGHAYVARRAMEALETFGVRA